MDIIVENKSECFSQKTTEIIQLLREKYPSFQKNILFIKYLLSYHKLNHSYTGGLNSYGLSLLYASFLEVKEYQ